VFDAADLEKLDRNQVRADYELLSGANKLSVKGDAPFVGGGSGKFRDPARGFLSLREEVVAALKDQELRWGGTDFFGESGDMMHFDDGNRLAEYKKWGMEHQTAKRKAESKAEEKPAP
jgi:hypothetical protein